LVSKVVRKLTLTKKLVKNIFSRRKEEKRPKEVEEAVRTVIPLVEPIQVTPRDPSWRVIESYYVYKPFVKVTIAETPEGPVYYVEEYGLTMEDKVVLDKLTQILMDEIKPPERPEEFKDLRGYVFEEAKRIAEKYRKKLGLVGTRRLKLLYYIERNLIGYGPIDPLMRDPNIEDISCNGVNIPIYIWHRKYESIPTNITFLDDEYLNEYVMKLAHMAGKHISIAFPIVDAMLPGKHRLAATFGREISVKGPTFTIRKFRERPFSPVELIIGGTFNSIMAAYLWTLIEHGKTALIAGGTGTGKSFTGDTKIIVRINGKPSIIEASKLYEIVGSRGYIVKDHIVKDVDNNMVEVLSIGNNYKLSWRRLRRIIKHRDHRPLVRVRTNTSIITTTLDHNFIKIDPYTLDLVAVEAKDLRPGDYIVNTWLDIEYEGASRVSTDYAYFLGLWSGDGNLDTYNKSIVLTTSNEDIIRRYRDLVKKLFGKNIHVVIDKRNNVKSLRFYHEQLYRYLSRLFNNDKSYTIRVPSEILFSGDKSVLLSYIAGILDSDGGIYVKRYKDKIELIVEFTFRSRELINGISFMLKRLRIQHVIKTRNIKGKPAYRILIYGMEALKLLTLVKDYVSIQISDVIEMANKYYLHRKRNPNYMIYPISEYLVRIREALGIGRKTIERELGLSSRYMRQYEYGRRKPSIDVLKKLYTYYSSKLHERPSWEAEALLKKLAMLMDGDIFFEKVISIEKIEPTNEYLFDLEVEDTHNFVIGQIGWRLNHNTTLLNAISLFIKPGMKIVSVEDTPELNLPHTNWVQLTSRESYIVGMGGGTEVKLFDLVKLSLRYRPDYIIVGEIRGEEAFVLFQAMAVGHGGMSTLHAETLDYAIKRLTSPPMNIPETYMRLMNVFIHINRVITRIEKGIVRVQRRINIVQEVEDFNKYITIAEWDPRTDQYKVYLERSIHLRDIATKRGLDLEDIIEEVYRKATVLNWMIYRNVTNVWDVSRIIFNYYYDPETIYKRAVEDLHRTGEKMLPEILEQPTPTIAASTSSLGITETEQLVGKTEVREDITRELFGRTRELRRR